MQTWDCIRTREAFVWVSQVSAQVCTDSVPTDKESIAAGNSKSFLDGVKQPSREYEWANRSSSRHRNILIVIILLLVCVTVKWREVYKKISTGICD